MTSLRASRRGAAALAFLMAILSATFCLQVAPAGAVTPNGTLQIFHLDVGQGDGALIVTPGGQSVMIDCGVYNNCSLVTNQLTALGVTHVDYHFASHYHADHIGCFVQSDNMVHFDQAWDRGGSMSSPTTTYNNYVSAAAGRRHAATKGRVWMLDSLSAHPVTITCVDMHLPAASDENANCIMLRLDYGNFHESFGGDQQSTYEPVFAPEMDTVLVYKVHHHGSATSSTDAWLLATAPTIGVISCGDGNGYGHPTAAAVNRMHARGVHTYWTETGAGVAPNPAWDKVAHGNVVINAVWQGGGKNIVFGGSGAGAFRDTITNPGAPPVVAVDDQASQPRLLRALVNPVTSIARFAVGVVGAPVSDLRVYSVDGREVRSLFRGVLPQGEQQLTWDGRDRNGRRVDSGVYFARFTTRGRSEVVKVLLLK
ncbi:MAG: hypothetical protein HZB25_11730 [Candidatus Eisenbacteria bacterium]|nr:hypothetical protein [Candidatus Eisenbacteria bacterium]